jgi:hypothetical protein
MQAIEFEATPVQHTIRIPDYIPDGVAVRVLLLVDDTKDESQFAQASSRLKLDRDEINARSPDYQTMAVNEIDMPSRDERYER